MRHVVDEVVFDLGELFLLENNVYGVGKDGDQKACQDKGGNDHDPGGFQQITRPFGEIDHQVVWYFIYVVRKENMGIFLFLLMVL